MTIAAASHINISILDNSLVTISCKDYDFCYDIAIDMIGCQLTKELEPKRKEIVEDLVIKAKKLIEVMK